MAKKRSPIFQEFKTFIMRGNVIDLAVGVIIGGAFGKIVTSLVNDLLMPIIGLALGKVNFSELKIVFTEGTEEIPEVAFKYGAFIQSLIDFLIIALCIFLIIRIIAKLQTRMDKIKAKEEEEVAVEEPPAEPEPTKEEVLLTEIRDLLKEGNSLNV